MLSFKIHRYGNDVLLAIADKDIIGKSFSDRKLTIEISEDFYGSNEADVDQITEMASAATIVNAIGPKAIKALTEAGMITPENVGTVCGLPHAQMVVMT